MTDPKTNQIIITECQRFVIKVKYFCKAIVLFGFTFSMKLLEGFAFIVASEKGFTLIDWFFFLFTTQRMENLPE